MDLSKRKTRLVLFIIGLLFMAIISGGIAAITNVSLIGIPIGFVYGYLGTFWVMKGKD